MYAPNRIMRRNPIRKRDEAAAPTELLRRKRSKLGRSITASDRSGHGDEQNVQQPMTLGPFHPWVLNLRDALQQANNICTHSSASVGIGVYPSKKPFGAILPFGNPPAKTHLSV
jgi:hypothetical protein